MVYFEVSLFLKHQSIEIEEEKELREKERGDEGRGDVRCLRRG